MPPIEKKPACQNNGTANLSRRGFLTLSGMATTTMLLEDLFPGRVVGQDPKTPVEVAPLPRLRIAAISDLQTGQRIAFTYPGQGRHTSCFVVKLGSRAGGGVGPDQDIVAFSSVCTHMGGSLAKGFRPQRGACVCPTHLTSFDLNRHGIVIAGHATESLPQILLELKGEDLFATGISGLLYGYAHNPPGGETAHA